MLSFAVLLYSVGLYTVYSRKRQSWAYVVAFSPISFAFKLQ